jgi:hypothetical protein
MDPLDEEELILAEEAEHLKLAESYVEVVIEDVQQTFPPDLVVLPSEVNLIMNLIITKNSIVFNYLQNHHSTVCVLPARDPHMLQFLDKIDPLTNNNWLTSGMINKAMELLKLQHPDIGGLYCCTLGGSLEFPQALGCQWLQIVHDGNNHWLVVDKGFARPEHILVYDSSPASKVCQHVLSCMSSLLKTPRERMTYVIRGCQKQGNGFDCGVFAIAFATSLVNGEDPSSLLYNPLQLRDHLKSCIDAGEMKPFPSTKCRPRTRGEKVETADVFCYCRRTDYTLQSKPDSLEMVGCDKKGNGCVLWVHKMCTDNFPVVKNDSKWFCTICVPRG